jgi:anaerobic ribonucleoside-triphosphate reductase activating protein
MTGRLRIHQIEPFSQSNGPGWRAVIWLQGCTLACPGCFNPETHLSSSGRWLEIDEVFKQVNHPGIEGISISGGEPLQQHGSLISFLQKVKQETSLSVVLFTGYNWQEVQRMPRTKKLLPLVDILLAGRYDQSQRIASGLLGSRNKTIHYLSTRYTPASLNEVPESEVIIKENGEIILSGINPIEFNGSSDLLRGTG